jgi:uncharacterized membrane protein
MTPDTPPPKPGLSPGEKTCWWLVLVGAAMAVAPFLAPDVFRSWNGGQYAMGIVGLLIALTAFFSSFLFRRRRLVRDALLDDAKLLLRWSYDPAEWHRYTEEDFVRERKAKWALFGIVAFFCVVIGGFFFVMDPRGGGPWVLGVLLGLCAVISVVILLTTSLQRKHRLAGPGGARLGEDGLLLGGELHAWKGFGARLEGCNVVEGRPPCIEFVYSTPAKNGRQINSVRVPIPTGCEAEAEGIVGHFREKLAAGS